MPNIHPSDEKVSLDTFRKNPGDLFFTNQIAGACRFKSYDGLHRAMKKAGIRPIHVGRRLALEGRDALRLVGASAAIPEDEPTPEGRDALRLIGASATIPDSEPIEEAA
jgi:hypothetical protein